MKKQWKMINPDPQMVATLSKELHCQPLIARLLAIRGICSKPEADRFLTPSFRHLTDPFSMADMRSAVQRIAHAICHGEKILVHGDYDADGITATALLVDFLRQCGARVRYAIPYRMTDGYGLSETFIVKRAKPAGIRLIITVDCGTSSAKAVSQARMIGIDTIVTDHHPSDTPPQDAIAVVNPNRRDCPSGLPHLAGVGVAFYLVVALRSHLRESGFWKTRREPNLKRLCDLVAIGTVADVVPLVKENRALTTSGVETLNRSLRPGIEALIKMSDASQQPVDTESIAFRLAPRINAAGRLAHARIACELLLSANRKKATRLAAALCRLNSRRQAMEAALSETILEHLDASSMPASPSVIVVDGDGWHEGILGIVASRLTRRFNCPSVVIGTRNGTGKGSARSVDSIDLTIVLQQCQDLLGRFGGHPLAAGLSLPTTNIDAFKTRMEVIIKKMTGEAITRPVLNIDASLPLSSLDTIFMDDLHQLEPFGQGNPAPVFMATNVRASRLQVVGQKHLKMLLQDKTRKGATFPAIWFNADCELQTRQKRFEKIAYRPQWNYWNGRKSLQLLIEDIQSEP